MQHKNKLFFLILGFLVACFLYAGINTRVAFAQDLSCSGTYDNVKLTTYFPGAGGIEGQNATSSGQPAYTLDQYVKHLNGATYVALAADKNLMNSCVKSGTIISIPTLDSKYNNGNPIPFRIVDTGSAFNSGGGAKYTHFDVALAAPGDPDYTIYFANQPTFTATVFIGNGPLNNTTANSNSAPSAPGTPLYQLIANQSGFVYTSWQALRVVINLVLILALLAISFSNILRININSYEVKKALPNLIIGVILANASFFIVKLFADFASATTFLFINLAGKSNLTDFISGIVDIVSKVAAGALPVNTSGALPAFLSIIIGIITIVGLLWLAVIMYVRLVAIYLLVIASPLAFLSYGVPGFDKYFKQWWQQFIKWMFMLTALCAVFWVEYKVSAVGTTGGSLAQAIISYVIFFFALSIPSKLGGKIVDNVTGKMKDNFATKYLGNEAKFYGKAAGSIIGQKTGLTRFQEWSRLNKENIERSIKLRRDETGANVRDKNSKAGLRSAILDLKEQEITGRRAKIDENNALRAGNTEKGQIMIEKASVSKKAKEAIEEELNTIKSNIDLKLVDSYNDKVKKGEKLTRQDEVLARWVRANANSETVKGLLGRNEGIAKSEYAKLIKKPLQALENYKAKFDEYNSLPENDKRRAKLKGEMDSIKNTFLSKASEYKSMGLFDSDAFKAGFAEDLKPEKGETDEFLHYVKGYDKDELLKRRRKQAFKTETEAVNAKIGDDVKEATVGQHQAMMDQYWKKLAEEFEKKNSRTASDAEMKEMRKMILTGNSSELNSKHGIEFNTIEDGVEKLETLKQASKISEKAEGVLGIFAQEMNEAGILQDQELQKMKANISSRKGQTRAREAIYNNLGGVQGSYSSRVIDSRGYEPTEKERNNFIEKLTTAESKAAGTPKPPPAVPKNYISPQDIDFMQVNSPDRYQAYINSPDYQAHRSYEQQQQQYQEELRQYNSQLGGSRRSSDDDEDYDDNNAIEPEGEENQ